MLPRDPDCAEAGIITGSRTAPKPVSGASGTTAAAGAAMEAQLMLLNTRQSGRRLQPRSIC
jgi:hypothetical protein